VRRSKSRSTAAADRAVNNLVRRVAATTAAVALLTLVACDVWIGAFRAWWDRHSLTGSVVASLLVVAVTALIFDEIVARRQRRDRAVSVAVQALIVYGQARRAYGTIVASGDDEPSSSGAAEELRMFASMLLTASPNLFDDPAARSFLGQLEAFAASMFRMVSARSRGGPTADARDRLGSELAQLQASVQPLVARIPTEDQSLLEGSDQG